MARACRSRRRAASRRTTTRPRCKSRRAVLAGVVWAIEHPRRGIVEPDEMDFARILDICRPYLGEVVGVYGDWTPLHDRERLFPEDLDRDDPWQFKNIRVAKPLIGARALDAGSARSRSPARPDATEGVAPAVGNNRPGSARTRYRMEHKERRYGRRSGKPHAGNGLTRTWPSGRAVVRRPARRRARAGPAMRARLLRRRARRRRRPARRDIARRADRSRRQSAGQPDRPFGASAGAVGRAGQRRDRARARL